MSVNVANHKLIDVIRQTPVLIRNSSGQDTDASYDATTPVAASEGNLIVILMGGVQTRTPTGMSGFTNVSRSGGGGGTLEMWYKIAGPSEPTSYNVVWSGNLQGGWAYFEVSNIDKTTPFNFETHVNSAGSPISGFSYTTYPIDHAGIAVADVALGSASTSWVIDNSFQNAGGIGSNTIYKAAYRIYEDTDPSETTSWSSSNSRSVVAGLMFFNGNPIS